MKLCGKCLKCVDGQCQLFKVALSKSKTNDYLQDSRCRGRFLEKKVKLKKIPTAKRLSKLKKELDRLWSLAVRNRDKKCVMCGNTGGLAAHHWILTRAQGNATRWEVDNGATLCYACLIHKVHSHPDVETMKHLRMGMSFISDSRIDEIIAMRNNDKQTEDELLEIKEKLIKLGE